VRAAADTGLVFITRHVAEGEVRALWDAMSNLKRSS
jgi:hypothetical protein